VAGPRFRTVADELLPSALAVHTHFSLHGYTVRIERAELGAPFTPTFTLSRDRTTLHVDVVQSVDLRRIREWVKYGKSTASDTRLAVCVPSVTAVRNGDRAELREMRVGLLALDGPGITEILPPQDLSLAVELPDLLALKRRVRRLLGHAYEQFNDGDWREGFEEACQSFEIEARSYLKQGTRTGRIKVQSKTGPKQLASAEVDGMTMGQLAQVFGMILTPTRLDEVIGQALARLNKDRIGVVHHKRKKVTENRLRRNVGRHMWVIVHALTELCS
jgi:hypothetical protein